MALETQVVDVRFDNGLDTKNQPKLRIPGKWDKLNNFTLADSGAPTVRGGISTLVAAANGNGLATHADELLVINGSTVSSVSTAGTDRAIAVTGQLANVFVSKKEVLRNTGMQDEQDCASGGGYTLYAWRDKDGTAVATGLNIMLVDEATGAVVIPNTQVITAAGAFCPRVVFAVDRFYLFYISGTSLYGRIILTSAPTTVGAQTAIVTSASLANLSFDACAQANTAVVAYGWADGVTSVRALQAFGSATPAIVNGPTNCITEAQLPAAALSGLACVLYSDNARVGVFSVGSGATAMSGMAGVVLDASATLNVTTAATQIDATTVAVAGNCHITACQSGSDMQVFSDRQSAQGILGVSPIRTVTVSPVLAIVFAASTLCNSNHYRINAAEPSGPKGPWIYGKAFNYSAGGSYTIYLPCAVLENYSSLGTNTANNNAQTGLYVLNGQTGVVMAKALYGAYGVAAINNNAPVVSTPCSSPNLGNNTFASLAQEFTRLQIIQGTSISPVGLSRFTFSPNTTLPPLRAQLGESTFFAGGALSAYDGQQLAEHGFFHYPEGVSCVAVGAASGSMTAGSHQVVVVYEWMDAAGNRHQSAPSPAVTVTVVATGSITVRIPTLQLTQKSVRLVPYMTQAGGLTFNRIDGTTGASLAVVMNDKTAATVTFTIVASDASAASGEVLYTQPNQAGTTLPNISPPPCNSLAVHQERLFFDVADDPGAFRYSQQNATGTGLQFSDSLGFTVDVNGGDIAGFSALDEKLLVFCERKPYVLFGSGPSANGLNNQYSELQEVPSDVGCSQPRSILRIPIGLMFKSTAKGWYLLGRDLTVSYIGDGVRAFNADSVSSGVLVENDQEARFSSLTGTRLVYAYDKNQWATYSTVLPASAGSIYPIADSIWWPTQGVCAHVTAALGLNYDDPSASSDSPGGTGPYQIITTARTGWLRLNSIDGFQRVRWLYLTMTGTNTNIDTAFFNIAVDFDDAYGSGYNFNVDLSTTVFPSTAALDLRHKLRRQKCKSVAFTFTETPDDARRINGIQALSLELGLKKGVNRLPAAQSVG